MELNSDVTANLRVTDGALLVVEEIEGITFQTEILIRQTLQERIKLVLMINKIDKSILEMKLDS